MRRRESGQSLMEFALSVTILVLLSAGVFDIGRGFALRTASASIARNAMRTATTSATSDPVGTAEAEVPAEIGGVTLVWGTDELASGNFNQCGGTKFSATSNCGDPMACVANSAYWTDGGNPNACIAVGVCRYSNGACLTGGAATPCSVGPDSSGVCWVGRPGDKNTAGNKHTCSATCWGDSPGWAVEVKVVLKVSLITPIVGAIVGKGGTLYVAENAVGIPLY